jgi:DNA polymerase sigma
MQVRALPPLRPLVLVIKAMLKEAGLNEVFTGGLSSYSLVNMVVAHLQAEGMQAAPVTLQPQQNGSSSSSWSGSVISQKQVQQHLTQLAQSSAAAAAAAAAAGSGECTAPGSSSSSGGWDLGCLLHGFFVRYGELFNYHQEAVSVAAGGIIAKHRSWFKEGALSTAERHMRLS